MLRFAFVKCNVNLLKSPLYQQTTRRICPKGRDNALTRCVQTQATSTDVSASDNRNPNAIYIHLPFCAQRCAYCAFTVLVSGRSALPSPEMPPPLPTHTAYIDMLCREIDAFFKLRPPTVPAAPVRSVYLGGGTPSLIHASLLERLLRTIRHHVNLLPDVELTCEMDPATFSQSSAVEFARLGVNRASIGAQSFDNHLLQVCGRIHRSEDIHTAVNIVRAAGIKNVSLDLISALPNQSFHDWKLSVEEAVSLNPQHISIYDLTLEPGTPFSARYKEGIHPLPSDAASADMLLHAAHYLKEAGYERYEISNFALGPTPSTSRSAHNMAYWRNEPFYAFGVGATSLIDNFRFARPTRLSQYEAYVSSLENTAQNTLDISVQAKLFPETSKQTQLERFEDKVINSMRLLQDGISFESIHNTFGPFYADRLAKAIEKSKHLVDEGLLQVIYDENGSMSHVRLTENGALIENSIVSDLLLDSVWRHPL